MSHKLNRPFAVIDIGSNTVRLVVYESNKKGSLTLYNEKVQCGLGKDITLTGKLNRDACSLAVSVIKRYIFLVRSMDAKAIVVATAAVRDAIDGKIFAEKLSKVCKVNIKILSGIEEARLSCLGVFSSFYEPSGFVGDLGGGSLELIGSHDKDYQNTVTLPFGTLREKSYISRERELIKRLDLAFSGITWLCLYNNKPFYAVGGAWRALAKVHMDWSNHPISVLHCYKVSESEALDLCRVLTRLSPSSLNAINAVSKLRRNSLSYAALVLERIISVAKPKNIIFSSYGLREGVLSEQFSSKEKDVDPLLASCLSISDESRFVIYREDVFNWLKPIFYDFPDSEIRLIKALILLSDVSWRIQRDYRAKFAFNKILYSPLIGINHEERVYIALAVSARYRGVIESRALGLLHSEQIKRAKIVGSSLDLIYSISGGIASTLNYSKLEYDSNILKIKIEKNNLSSFNGLVKKKLQNFSMLLKCEYFVEEKN